MAHQAKGKALWRKENKEEQQLMIDHPKYADILNNKRPSLTKIIQPSHLWSHLRKYGVLDKEIQEEITKPTRQQTVEELLDHLECGPCWRLHAFLRACSLTHQDHVVSHIGLSADTYSGPSPPESDTEDSADSPPLPPPGTSAQKQPPPLPPQPGTSTQEEPSPPPLPQPGTSTEELPPPPPQAGTSTEKAPPPPPSAQSHHRPQPVNSPQEPPPKRQRMQDNATWLPKSTDRPTSPSTSRVISDQTKVNPQSDPHAGASTSQPARTLREALAVHYRYYDETLMMSKVFDFKHHDPESDIYNLDECHIELDADFNQYKRISQQINMRDILGRFGNYPAPRNVLLVGPPGAGKSTFLKRFAYLYSKDFLQYHRGLQACPNLMTVVYVPARSLTSDIWGSIEREVCCQEKDRKYVVDQIRVDSESSVLLDGIDEVRDAETLRAIQTFIDLNHKYAGPRIVVSARTGLSRLNNSSFDRFLSLEGFTINQGLEYTHKYITIHSQVDIPNSGSSSGDIQNKHHPTLVLDYIQTNQDKLRPILSNPLRAHILSGLAVEGKLKLDNEKVLQPVELLTTMENYFIQRETEGKGVPTAERQQFYKLSLFGLLANIREFTEDHLKIFCVHESAYVSFFRRETKRDSFASSITVYHFEHEILYEFFAARALKQLPDWIKWAVLLHICSREILRNLQKLIFGILGEYETENSLPLMVGMARLILLQHAQASYEEKQQQQQQQNRQPQEILSNDSGNSAHKEWGEFISNLQTLFTSIASTIPAPGDILQTQDGDDSLRDGAVTQLWDKVGTTFSQLTQLTKMNQSPYGENYWEELYFSFGGAKTGFVGKVLLNLLSDCTPQQQNEIADSSYLLMLPCHTVYPCGSMRWVVVSSDNIDCWSSEDLAAGILLHTERGTHRETTDNLHIDFSETPLQWGRVPDDHWTRGVWDTALQAVVSHYTITDTLDIYLPDDYSPPLQGLLYSITHLDTSHYTGGGIDIRYGTITLLELHQWYQESGGTHTRRFTLSYTNLQLPADTHTRDPLLQWVGEEFLQDVRRHITDKGLTGGRLDGVYRFPGGTTLWHPIIAFM